MIAVGVTAWTSPSTNPPGGGGALNYFNGNIGVGTSTPGYPFTVVGTIYSSTGGFRFPDNTTQTTAASGGIPTGAVMYFNLAACPTGWTELTTARGRYLVGLPSSGTLAGTSGTALTDLESRPVGQHNHGITDPGHSHSYYFDIWGHSATNAGYMYFQYNTTGANSGVTDTKTTGITVNNTGDITGTNAPYMQLLVCQKS